MPNTTPIYPLEPVTNTVVLNYTNPNRDGSGSVSVGFMPYPNGAYVDRIWVQLSPSASIAGATSTANIVRVWISDNYTNWYLYKEIETTGVTLADTSIAAKRPFNISPPIMLSPYQMLGCTLAQSVSPTIDQYAVTFEGYRF